MKQAGKYLIILIFVMALWNTIIIKPLKIFTVFLHELGHALMGVVFGSGIQGFQINLNESGHAIVQVKGWFSAFMVTSGGYLGSVFFALLILHLKKTRIKKYILGTLAIILLGVSIMYSGFNFTLLYAASFAAVVLVIYMYQNEKVMDWALDIIGVSSLAYAIYDTFIDTILLQVNLQYRLFNGWNERPISDAVRLEEMTHIPSVVWGAVWLGISIFAVYITLIKPGKTGKRTKAYGG